MAWADTIRTVPASGAAVQQLTEVIRSPSVRAYLARFTDSFAGEYIDDGVPGGPTWVVRFTTDITDRQRELGTLLPPGTSVDVTAATHTWRELERLMDAINSERAALLSAGVQLNRIGPDPRTNSVSVGVAGNRDRATTELAARFPGAPITVDLAQPAQPVPAPATSSAWMIAAVVAGSVASVVLAWLAFVYLRPSSLRRRHLVSDRE